jgi:hypothetical protein
MGDRPDGNRGLGAAPVDVFPGDAPLGFDSASEKAYNTAAPTPGCEALNRRGRPRLPGLAAWDALR